MKNFLLTALLLMQIPVFAQTKAANLAKVKEAWANFKAAYEKNDRDTLKQLLQIPIRENPEDTVLALQNNSARTAPWRTKPVQMDLPKFLAALKNLKKYNLKVIPRLLTAENLSFTIFKGYSFDPADKYYAIDLERLTKNKINMVTGYSMVLYFKIHKGACLLFAFDPETYFQNTGD